MNTKNKLLTGIGALVFMALMALNVQLVNSSKVDNAGFASLSLVEIAAQAQTEGGCNCEPNEECIDGKCYPISDTNNGFISSIECPDGPGYTYTCGGRGNNCPGDDC